jgi:hypothetical protein
MVFKVVKKVMYNLEIKIIAICMFACIFYSCQKPDVVKIDVDSYVNNYSENIKNIRKTTKDYFQYLIDNEKEIVLPIILASSWSIDPVIYISEDKRRFYTHLLKRKVEWRNSTTDMATVLIGAKIRDRWHYLQGDVTYYPRDDYKSDGSKPFTFEELSYLVNRRLLPNIVKVVDGEYVVSEEFFANTLKSLDSHVEGGDSLFLSKVNGYSTKSVPKEKLERIRKEQRESRPRIVESKSLWQQWFGKKKLFDSKEWKNRRKE